MDPRVDAWRRVSDALEAAPPTAVVAFDWDNTVIRGDIGDLTMLELLERVGVTQVRAWDGPLREVIRHSLAGRTGTSLIDGLAEVLWRETLAGEPAFDPRRTPSMRAAYAWMAALAEAQPDRRAVATRALAKALARPIGSVCTLGSVEVEDFVRPRPFMFELAERARSLGREVWVVSASQQDLVEVAVETTGFPAHRVLGAGPRQSHGVDSGWPAMTYDEGKPAALRLRGGRSSIALACGDSDTDFALLREAGFRVLVDRGQPRVTALAQADPERALIVPHTLDAGVASSTRAQ